LSFLFKTAQQPDRKGALGPAGVAARSSVQLPVPIRKILFKSRRILCPLIEIIAEQTPQDLGSRCARIVGNSDL